jgi:hypothetical protein
MTSHDSRKHRCNGMSYGLVNTVIRGYPLAFTWTSDFFAIVEIGVRKWISLHSWGVLEQQSELIDCDGLFGVVVLRRW